MTQGPGQFVDLSVDICDEVRDLFPELGVGALAVGGLRSAGVASKVAAASDLAAVRMKGMDSYDQVSTQPEVQLWRGVFSKMHLRPGAYRSSLEALMRAWVVGRSLNSGLPLVDLYNFVSIAEAAPLGAVDSDRLGAGKIALRFARPDQDHFKPIGGSVKMDPRSLAVSYCVDSEIICYALNHRDSVDYAIGEASDRVVFLAEWTCEDQRQRAEAALATLAGLLADAGAEPGCLQRFG